MATRITAAFVVFLMLVPAMAALAVPALEAGDILTASARAIRVLDGTLRPEVIVTGIPLEIGRPPASGCTTGGIVSDGERAIVFDWASQRFVSVDLATGSWQLVAIDPASDVPNPHLSWDAGYLALEPGGSFLVANGFGTNRELIRIDPATGDASLLNALADPPDGLAVASDGTIVVFTSTPSNVPTASKLFEIDPLSDVATERISSVSLGVGAAMAVAPNGDVLLGTAPNPSRSQYSVLRVDSLGAISTVSGVGVGSGPAFDPIGALAVLADGDLLVLPRREVDTRCPDPSMLLRVDASTGDRSVLSGGAVGAGPPFAYVPAVTVTPDGSILAIEAPSNTILSVDAETGDREVVFDPTVGGGPREWVGSPAIAIDGRHRIVWGGAQKIGSIDPTTGDRSVLAADGPATTDIIAYPFSIVFTPDGDLLTTAMPGSSESGLLCQPRILRIDTDTGERSIASGTVGAGPPLVCPTALVMGADGYAYVLDLTGGEYESATIMRVDVANGNRKYVSDATHGSGPIWSAIRSMPMTADRSGMLYVADFVPAGVGSSRLLRVSPITGVRSIVSGDGVGAGDPLRMVRSIAVATDGAILVNHLDFPGVMVVRVDPVTGDRTPLSSENARGLAVVPALVPEPSAAALALVAFAILVIRSRRCRTLGSESQKSVARLAA